MTMKELGKFLRTKGTKTKQSAKDKAAQERAEENRLGRNPVLNGTMSAEDFDAMCGY